ncbi:ATP-NAD kinase family protein [Shewanella surugensis]|uniref:ATP-NAD kinase family protein n=1 Tax=Shewanella surugensis TaxID=212020 RepID=A0ABT0LD97_9GAMM|nr:ATP-NAD kinase family protein [Shewanella surugensis]MCL1125674.1 ATP-NAD kinase family protein [Shewanella surugensis]
MKNRFRLGVIINPLAGLGGSVALKGSDGVALEALSKGALPQAMSRMAQALSKVEPDKDRIDIVTASGDMGENIARKMGFTTDVVYQAPIRTQAQDTKAAVTELLKHNLDLLLFAGGDGTARDIYTVVDDALPVLGVPAGVKIHSGVYGVSPYASGHVVKLLLDGELVSLMSADVMDIDEALFRQGHVQSKWFGEMQVPAEPHYVQAVKQGGIESEAWVLADIAAEAMELMDDELCIMGSGSTIAFIMAEMGVENTLLGVDLIKAHSLIQADLTATELLEQTVHQSVKLMITLIGGQGHILGRGNQQLSPALIRQIGKENIIILATKAKLKALEGRPLMVDSGDPVLDKTLAGYYKVITGYHDYVMYPVAEIN